MGALVPPVPALRVANDATSGDGVANRRRARAAAAQVFAISQRLSISAHTETLIILGRADAQQLAHRVLRARSIHSHEFAAANGRHEVLNGHGHQRCVVEAHIWPHFSIAVGDRDVCAIPKLLGRGRFRGARVRGHVMPPQNTTARLHI